jgi:hypothetical protein
VNKYLMLSAAALLAGTTGTEAGTAAHSFQFASASGGSYCDGGTVYTNGSSIWSWQHTNNDCAGGVGSGNGRLGKQGESFKGADMSDNSFAENYHSYAEVINYLLPKKFKDRSRWEMDCSFSGTTAFQCGGGRLIIDGAPHLKAGRSTTSALTKLRQLRRATQ